ncbi:unnamed protein product [Rotaria magnacalcarata]|uniref:BRCT domain-containing protein n=1 Tax=Rotaria magnacalcarata TaxID=392030 RepID=A0A819MCS0_9BILA|nr:unnamed protein product [Rotaria magnacalcarata]CAF3977671.1 unnamed protein product [Rotaria magnacalcarata]
MKKLEEPSLSTLKSQTQTIETQVGEAALGPIYPTQTRKTHRQTMKQITQSEISQQQSLKQMKLEYKLKLVKIHRLFMIARCSKLERLFMEKISRFISFVPTLPNTHSPIIIPENHHKRRMVQSYSRLRRFRARRKTHHRMVIPCISNNESTTVEEISDETTTESENQPKENVEIPQEQNKSIPSIVAPDLDENLVSITMAIEKTLEAIDDLSSIEKLDTTTSQFRLFITRFGFSTSPTVDSSTTHIIVNENSSLVCSLTGKIIQGIACHLFIVSNRWLNDCLALEIIVDERPYEIRGYTSLGADHGGMRRSRLIPSYLLEKYSIYLRCSPNDCARLQTIEQVQELVELCGAKLVRNFSEIKTIDNERQMVLVLGINGFSGGDNKPKALLDACQQFNVRCVNIYWLLISIAKFDVQPLENYDINQI